MKRRKLYILVAYPYLTASMIAALHKFDTEHPGVLSLIVDSGAFTAWKSGNPIKLEDYCRFLEKFPVEPEHYVALDVVGEPAATQENLDRMLARGLQPVPVLTPGEDVATIDRLYGHTDLIAAGGLTSKYGKEAIVYIKNLMDAVGDRDIHLLGYTSMPLIKHLRPYSCDSSSWESGARYGRVQIYVGNGRFKTFTKKDFVTRPPTELVRACLLLGVDINQARSAGAWTGGSSFQRTLGAAGWLRLQQDAEDRIGTKIYLAMTTSYAFGLVSRRFLRMEAGA